MKAPVFAVLVILFSTPTQVVARQDAPASPIPIHLAALRGNVDAVRQHVEAGTDLDARDAFGSTPLIIAATFGKTEVARALIDGGADLAATNLDGATPLHVAAFLCRTEIVEALLEGGADRQLRDNAGSTALDAVEVPFEVVKPVYDRIATALAPFGLVLDFDRIRDTRPVVAELLRRSPG